MFARCAFMGVPGSECTYVRTTNIYIYIYINIFFNEHKVDAAKKEQIQEE